MLKKFKALLGEGTKAGKHALGMADEFEPIVADRELFEELQERLPDEPLVKIRPKKDNPGMEHGLEFARSLYTYSRSGPFGINNSSPTNSFEIWYDDEKIQFFFSPEDEASKNKFTKHVKDKYPGSRLEEKAEPFPEIDEGDFIAGARMTLRREFAMPMQMPIGPDSFDRDPFGDLTSEMVVEEESLSDGTRVKGDEVGMVVQIAYQPIHRDWSRKPPYGKDFEALADSMKKPKMKGSGATQFLRVLFEQDIKTMDPSPKVRKASKLVAKLRGRPGFYFRLRVLCFSPYKEMAQRHAKGVCEVFENYYNPVTEQGLTTVPLSGDSLRRSFLRAGARRMNISLSEKLSAGKDVLSMPEMAGILHIPNESIETPGVDWTRIEAGSGVPPEVENMDDVMEKAAERPDENEDDGRLVEFEESAYDEDDDGIDLSIDMGGGYDRDTGSSQEASADGRGLQTDEALFGGGGGEESDEPEESESTDEQGDDIGSSDPFDPLTDQEMNGEQEQSDTGPTSSSTGSDTKTAADRFEEEIEEEIEAEDEAGDGASDEDIEEALSGSLLEDEDDEDDEWDF